MKQEIEQSKLLLRIGVVEDRISMSRAHIYTLIKRGDFPKPLKVGFSSLWVASEIDEWIASKLAQRSSASAA